MSDFESVCVWWCIDTSRKNKYNIMSNSGSGSEWKEAGLLYEKQPIWFLHLPESVDLRVQRLSIGVG